ncbi:hypothetical protein ACFFTM_13085 [Pseudoduganella plicata]|nr:hypothetical protein [Pseudoduganella plicata]
MALIMGATKAVGMRAAMWKVNPNMAVNIGIPLTSAARLPVSL